MAWWRPDLIAGLSAGAVVIPQAMAYATIASLPVQVGLYTCIVPMVVYAALGSSRALSVSTTSTVATLCAATLIASGGGQIVTLTLLVGGLLLAARVLRLAPLVENISPAVLVGVKTGVGLTVAAGQLPKLLGVPANPDAGGFFSQLWSGLKSLGNANPATLILAVATIALLVLLSRFAPRIPGPLLAVGGALVLVPLLGLTDRGVALIDKVPGGLPVPEIPPLSHVSAMLPGALAIALMVFLETVAVARGVRERGDPRLDNDRELVAIGAASTAGAFFGSMPPAGGFSQTAVSVRAGARSQAAALVTAALAVLVALFLAPLLSELPQATLGAMVLVAVLGLIKPAEFARLARISPVELVLAIVTTVVGLTGGLLAAVAVGVAGTLGVVLHELNHPDLTALPAPPGMLALRLGAPLYTANIRTVQRALLDRAERATPRVLLLDATALGALGTAALDGLRELDTELAAQGTTLWIAALPFRAVATARRTTWWAQWETGGRIWPTVEAATAAFAARP